MRKSYLLLFLILLFLFPGGLKSASNSTKVTFGRTLLSTDLQTVPDSSTALSASDTWIFQIVVTNTTGTAATFTMTDRASSPKTLLPAVSIAANTTYIIPFPEGQKMKGGILWLTGTTSALTASIVAFKIP